MLNTPGQYAGPSATPRECLISEKGLIYGQGVIGSSLAYDGGNTTFEDEIREGMPMAQITASKLWVPCKRTRANGAGTAIKALIVDSAAPFKVGDSVVVAAQAANVVTAINYGTNTLTLTSNSTWVDEDVVYVSDGSQTCLGILNQFVKLKDLDGVWRDKPFGRLVLAGLVDPNKCLGDIAAIRADTGNKLQQILFADDAGQV